MASHQQPHHSESQATRNIIISANIDGSINLDTNSPDLLKSANFDNANSAVIDGKLTINIGGRTIPCTALILEQNSLKNITISKISINRSGFLDFKEMSKALVGIVSSQPNKESSSLKTLKADSLESFDRLKLNDVVERTIKILSSDRNINFDKAKKILDRVEGNLYDSFRILGIDKNALSKFNELVNLLQSNKKSTKLATLALVLNSNGLSNDNKEAFRPIKQVVDKFIEIADGRSLNTTFKAIKPNDYHQMKDLASVLNIILSK